MFQFAVTLAVYATNRLAPGSLTDFLVSVGKFPGLLEGTPLLLDGEVCV